MRIAICDDNIADRKHLQRLLERESDKRAGTPNIFYIDSFGDKEHFLFNPLLYDLIFLDMTGTPTLAEEIVAELGRLGYEAPLVMYSSTINHSANPNLPTTIIHKQKPYLAEQLPELIALAEEYQKQQVITMEFRTREQTYYIRKEDILYAELISRSELILHLNDGTIQNIVGDHEDFTNEFEPYMEFYPLNSKLIINANYISLLLPFSVMMHNHETLRISPFTYFDLKRWCKMLKEKEAEFPRDKE
ncbi:MAG: hypothetical protein IJ326_09685 [Lachnospiraceae bacterium]|nr:hypothetical protein [Lachnospiraceae bacterium]